MINLMQLKLPLSQHIQSNWVMC